MPWIIILPFLTSNDIMLISRILFNESKTFGWKPFAIMRILNHFNGEHLRLKHCGPNVQLVGVTINAFISNVLLKKAKVHYPKRLRFKWYPITVLMHKQNINNKKKYKNDSHATNLLHSLTATRSTVQIIKNYNIITTNLLQKCNAIYHTNG